MVTAPASSVTTTSARLNGGVNPNGISSTAAWFDYGLTTSHGNRIEASPGGVLVDPISGTSMVSLSATITGLNCGTQYHFRTVAANTSTSNGPEGTFTTAPCTGLAGTVQALAADPTNGQIVYAGTTSGIYRTADGGATWTRVWSGAQDIGLGGVFYSNVKALAIRPGAACTIYAAIDTDVRNYGGWPTYTIVNSYGILAQSDDCGAAWKIPSPGPSGRVAESLAFSHTGPEVLYAAIVTNDATCYSAFPAGYCIDQLVTGTSQIRTTTSNARLDYLDPNRGVVATDPASACIAYYGRGTKVYQNTSCSDLNWLQVGAALSGAVAALVVHPTNQATLLAGTSGGQIYPEGRGPEPVGRGSYRDRLGREHRVRARQSARGLRRWERRRRVQDHRRRRQLEFHGDDWRQHFVARDQRRRPELRLRGRQLIRDQHWTDCCPATDRGDQRGDEHDVIRRDAERDGESERRQHHSILPVWAHDGLRQSSAGRAGAWLGAVADCGQRDGVRVELRYGVPRPPASDQRRRHW